MLWRAIFLFPSPALQLSYLVALLRFSSLLSIATSPLRRPLLRTRDSERLRKSRLRESPVASRRPPLPPSENSSWNASTGAAGIRSGQPTDTELPGSDLDFPRICRPDPTGAV